jgi:hypothetical protein
LRFVIIFVVQKKHSLKTLEVMKQEQLVEKLQEMKLCQRFIDALETPNNNCFRSQPRDSHICATIEVSEKSIEKIKCTADIMIFDSFFKKRKKNQFVYSCEKFAIYRELRYLVDLQGSRIKERTFILVTGDEIRTRFYYDDEDFIVTESKDIVFISFPACAETIGIVKLDINFRVFLPFAITSAQEAEVTLECGLKARVSLERVDRLRLFVNFTF